MTWLAHVAVAVYQLQFAVGLGELRIRPHVRSNTFPFLRHTNNTRFYTRLPIYLFILVTCLRHR